MNKKASGNGQLVSKWDSLIDKLTPDTFLSIYQLFFNSSDPMGLRSWCLRACPTIDGYQRLTLPYGKWQAAGWPQSTCESYTLVEGTACSLIKSLFMQFRENWTINCASYGFIWKMANVTPLSRQKVTIDDFCTTTYQSNDSLRLLAQLLQHEASFLQTFPTTDGRVPGKTNLSPELISTAYRATKCSNKCIHRNHDLIPRINFGFNCDTKATFCWFFWPRMAEFPSN